MAKKDIFTEVEKIVWFRYAQRFSSDFPLIFVNYFFKGQGRYLGLKRLLYINKGAHVYAYRDKVEFKTFYNRINNLKKNNFRKIAQETDDVTYKILNILKNISYINIRKMSAPQLLKEFKIFNNCFYKFAAFFIYIQYIGQVYKDDPKILKYFDKEVIRIIRFTPIIPDIKKKFKIYFDVIGHKFLIKADLFFWLFPEEIEGIFKEQGLNKRLLQQAKLRKKFYLFVSLDGRKLFCNENKNAIKIAEKLFNSEKIARSTILKGIVAYKGLVKGKARIILNRKDFKKIKRGDVLVAVFTMPYYLPLFKKASAIVTDEGGLLSHASIMARELKKICIIGTKIATKTFKDGDLLEVNANSGLVKLLKKRNKR